MSMQDRPYDYDYRPRRRRKLSVAEVKRRRARRRRRIIMRIALLVSMLCITVFAIVMLVSALFGGGDDDKKTDGSSVAVNATADSTFDVEADSTTEEDTTEEPATEEMTTPATLRYGDEMYTDGELVVCIDAGHGGNDSGCVGIDGSYEKDDVLMLAMLVVKELEEQGVKVVTTRTTDVWVDLSDRPLIANQKKADIFISIHRNSLENDTVTKGFEAWIYSDNSENSEELANVIMSNLESAGISKNRGVKKGTQGNSEENYKVNSGSAMPSVLLEMGFMSSPTDNQLYKGNAKQYARAIANAIIEWSADKPY